MNTQIITEFVRFNNNGSSDHIKVVGDQLLSTEHYEVSPFVRIPRCFETNPKPLQDDEIVAWMVCFYPQEPPNERR